MDQSDADEAMRDLVCSLCGEWMLPAHEGRPVGLICVECDLVIPQGSVPSYSLNPPPPPRRWRGGG